MGKWLFDIPTDTSKIRVRIRGPYSTALTKLFLEHGFEITQPSPKVCERFKFDSLQYLSPHIDIQAKGSRASIESLERLTPTLKEILFKNFSDVIAYQEPYAKNSIWRGVVTQKLKDGYIVRFSINQEGFLPSEEARQQYKEGDLVVVEVKGYDQKSKRILLTEFISIPGEFVVLLQKEIIKASRKIKGPRKVELLDIGNILRPPGWGVIFRTSAMQASLDAISDELKSLHKYAEEFQKSLEKIPAFTQIREGINILTVIFPQNSKMTLDKIRSEVTPTVKGHHWIKTLGKAPSLLIDFIEELGCNYKSLNFEELSRLAVDFIRKNILPKKGDVISIHHIKPTMKRIILGPAKIIKAQNTDDGLEYIMFRRFSSGSYYDGINAPRESGDFGITVAREGDTKLLTAYYSMNLELKGIYVNINTPIEIYPHSIRYIDLEIDVVRTYENNITIIDRKKLEKYLEQGIISRELYEWAIKKAEEYKTWLETHGLDYANELYEIAKEAIEEEFLTP
ncbi:MAG: ribonuclease E/G [Candidatus Korarchaeota archaeon]|nr:ribonuclease E/G [Thermoproteota archaeon]